MHRFFASSRGLVGVLGAVVLLFWQCSAPPTEPPGNSNASASANSNANTNTNTNTNTKPPVRRREEPPPRRRTDPPPASVTYHKDVRPILTKSCIGCHYQGGIGLFPLTDFKNVQTYAEAIKDAVKNRRMPPYPADSSCQEYQHNPSLSQKEIETIEGWVKEGSVEGDPATYKEPKDHSKVGLSRVDLSLKMPQEYTPIKVPDDYRCFVVPWPKKEKVYVSGFQIKAGNPALVHHVIAYIAKPKDRAKFEAKEAKEAGPGYECFGGPGGNAGWLGAWAPGTPGGDYPEGTGIEVEPGSAIIIQMHYNSLQKKPGADQTAIELKLEKSVQRPSYLVPLASTRWKIPAGQDNYLHTNEMKNPVPIPVMIHTVMFHMHLLGKTGRLYIRHADGSKTCLLNIPRWDFNWQLAYPLKKPVVVKPSDRIGIECSWDNSAANQPVVDGKRLKPRDVTWGDGSTDEMCLGVVYVSP